MKRYRVAVWIDVDTEADLADVAATVDGLLDNGVIQDPINAGHEEGAPAMRVHSAIVADTSSITTTCRVCGREAPPLAGDWGRLDCPRCGETSEA